MKSISYKNKYFLLTFSLWLRASAQWIFLILALISLFKAIYTPEIAWFFVFIMSISMIFAVYLIGETALFKILKRQQQELKRVKINAEMIRRYELMNSSIYNRIKQGKGLVK